MKLRVGTASDIGKARERNEDAFLAVHPLYVVADGMGGHRGGDVASSIVVEELSKSDEDGMRLGELMREESVLEILEGHRDPQETSEALVDAANRAGGLDNITVVVIDFEEGDGV